MPRLFTLTIGLAPVPATAGEVQAAFHDRLDVFRPTWTPRPGGLQLRLTIPAADMWLAVLEAMVAVHNSGYTAVSLHGHQLHQACSTDPISQPTARVDS
jgi:hypothetical protein